MRETLEIVRALWRGEPVDYEGEHFQLHNAQQQPGPLGAIPIVIGGAGRSTMELVAAHADWWNVHIGILDRLDDMRARSGTARCSLQLQVAVVPTEERRAEVTQQAQRRFGPTPLIGTVPELVDHFGALVERGVERVYIWFCDFAPPETLLAFGEDAVRHFSSPD